MHCKTIYQLHTEKHFVTCTYNKTIPSAAHNAKQIVSCTQPQTFASCAQCKTCCELYTMQNILSAAHTAKHFTHYQQFVSSTQCKTNHQLLALQNNSSAAHNAKHFVAAHTTKHFAQTAKHCTRCKTARQLTLVFFKTTFFHERTYAR